VHFTKFCKLGPRTLHIDLQALQGLDAPNKTSMSYLATDPGSRPSAAQPRTELSMATHPRSRTMEAACGNDYAPVWGMLVMMMMMTIH